MKHKRRIIVITAIVLLIGATITYYISTINRSEVGKTTKEERRGPRDKKVAAMVYVASYNSLDEGIVTLGSMLANEEVDIASEIAGKIERISFEEGASVKKDAILVKINDDDLQAQLKRAIFQRDLLKEKLNRNKILLDKDAISRESFDQIETDFNMVEADIQLLKVKIDKTEIRSPFSGTIGFRHISPGDYLQPNSLVAKLVDASKLKLEFSIPEKYKNRPLKGSSIEFTTEGDNNTYNAKIYAIDPIIDQKTRTMTLRALFNNSAGRISPGMSARVMVGKKTGTTIMIPTQAIVPDTDSRKVWIVEQGDAVSRSVVTGVRNEDMIEIKSGLSVGDSVVITGLMQIKEGAKLQITN